MKKKLTFLLAIVIILAMVISPVNAAPSKSDPVTAAPLATATASYSFINYAYSVISVSSGSARASNYISCQSNVDKIIISCYIQKYDSGWKTVAHKRTTTYSNRASLYNSAYVSSGYTYRVRTYFYAYDGSSVESTYCTDSRYY